MRGSEEIMWLALSSIALADWFERNRTTDLVSTNENEVLPPQPTGEHGFLPKVAKLLSAM
jgi:hypothetical protein